ncbi:hypothetical protein S245_004279 [Arachis hypogaea]
MRLKIQELCLKRDFILLPELTIIYIVSLSFYLVAFGSGCMSRYCEIWYDGKKFWNLFHMQPMRDQKREVQYFIGVQLDDSQHVEPLHNCITENTAKEGEQLC